MFYWARHCGFSKKSQNGWFVVVLVIWITRCSLSLVRNTEKTNYDDNYQRFTVALITSTYPGMLFANRAYFQERLKYRYTGG